MTGEIRYVTPDETLFRRLLPVARRIFTATFADRYGRDAFERFCDGVYGADGTMVADFRSPGVRWRVATVAGEPVGYAKVTSLRAPAPNPDPFAVELQQLYVVPELHGSGVAETLMRWALAIAQEIGATEVYLTVFDHNERAKRFYARHGFSEVGRCTFQLGDHIDDDRVWRRPLRHDAPGLLAPDGAVVTLRPARLEDAAMLTAWDSEPHVIRCTTDDPDAEIARDAGDWEAELSSPTPYFEHLVGEADGRPVGAMLIIDPALEPTHYWGEVEQNLRAIDIWLGPADALGRGYGTLMMTQALDRCFAIPSVTAIVIDPLASNTAARRFYGRLGFHEIGPRIFGEDRCLVHRLERSDWTGGPEPG